MVKGKILGEAILYDLYGAKLVQQLALNVHEKILLTHRRIKIQSVFCNSPFVFVTHSYIGATNFSNYDYVQNMRTGRAQRYNFLWRF